jgi:hypothetical protein
VTTTPIKAPYLIGFVGLNGAATATCTAGAATAPGDAIVACADTDSLIGSPYAVSDSKGNTYQPATPFRFGQNPNPVIFVAANPVPLVPGDTVTANFTNVRDVTLSVIGCPGIALGAPAAQYAAWFELAGSQMSLVSAELDTAPELAVAFWTARAGQGGITLAGDWQSVVTFQGPNNTHYVNVAYQVAQGLSPVTATASTSATGPGWAGLMVLLRPQVNPTATLAGGCTVTAAAAVPVRGTAALRAGGSIVQAAELAVPAAPVLPVFPAGWSPSQQDFTTWIRRSFRALTGRVVFRAQQTGSQSLTGGVFTPVAFGGVLEDPYGGWSATATAAQAAYSWLAPWTGYYQVTFGWSSAAGAGWADTAVAVTGGTPQVVSGAGAPASLGGGGSGQVIVPMIGGADYLQFLAQPASTVTNDTSTAGRYPWVEIIPLTAALIPVLTTAQGGVLTAYLPLTGGVLTGPLTLDGGVIIPPGAASGYVLTSDAAGHATWQPATGGGGGGDDLVLEGTSETIGTATFTAAGPVNLDVSAANVYQITLAGNPAGITPSFAIINTVATGCEGLTLYITQGGTGSYSINWPLSVTWLGGTAPVLAPGIGALTVVTLETLNGGATWYGAQVTQAPPLPVPVIDGGTGVVSTVPYGVVTGGATATAALQNTGTGAPGYVLTANGATSAPTWQAPSLALLTQAAVQASAYTAAPNQLVPVSTVSGPVTVTLPAAPVAGTLIGVKMVLQGGTSVTTVAAGGTDVINRNPVIAGAAVSATLTLPDQGTLMQYDPGPAGFAFTGTSSSAILTATGSGFAAGDVVFLTGGSLPAGFSTGTRYYVVTGGTNTFQLSATYGGAAITATGSGSGTVQMAGIWYVVADDLPLSQLDARYANVIDGVTVSGTPLNGQVLTAYGTGGNTANWQSPMTGGSGLTPTAVQTSGTYNANPGDFVPCNTTAGVVTVQLPHAPVDKAIIGVKLVIQGGTNAVTVAPGTGDAFNVAGATAPLTLPLPGQGIILQYDLAAALWYVQDDDLPLAALDTRYANVIDGVTVTGTPLAGQVIRALTANSANWQSITGGSGTGLTPTAVQTSGTYNANPGDFVPCNTTSATVTIQLPPAPVDGSVIGAKLILPSSTPVNLVTILAGAGDMFNKAGGVTTETLSLFNQGIIVQYQHSTGIWYVQDDDLPLSALDGRYASLATAQTLSNKELASWTEACGVITAATGTVNLNAANDNVFQVTLTGATTFTFTTPAGAGSGVAVSFSLFLSQDATGGRTVTWPSSVTWLSGSAPVLPTAANALSVLVFTTLNGGTTWYGAVVTGVAGGNALGTITGATGAQTLALATADVWKVTMTGNVTFTITGALAGVPTDLTVYLLDAAGTHTVTWPGSVTWLSGAAPPPGTLTIVTFETLDGGVTWYGTQVTGAPTIPIPLADLPVQASSTLGMFGDGSDGAATLDGTATVTWATLSPSGASGVYTMTRDVHSTGLVVNSGITLKPAGYRIFCQGTVTNGGTISVAGNTATTSTGGSSTGNGSVGSGRGGGNGGTGVSGAGAAGGSNGIGAPNGAAGAGGAGTSGTGGAAGTPTALPSGWYRLPFTLLTGNTGAFLANDVIAGAPGGGGGGSDASSNAGGGGGSGGGLVVIFAWSVVNNGTITVAGGGGAAAAAGNAGGGGGGGGGAILVYTLIAWAAGTTTVTGGTGGGGHGTGSAGATAGAGTAVNIVLA